MNRIKCALQYLIAALPRTARKASEGAQEVGTSVRKGEGGGTHEGEGRTIACFIPSRRGEGYVRDRSRKREKTRRHVDQDEYLEREIKKKMAHDISTLVSIVIPWGTIGERV